VGKFQKKIKESTMNGMLDRRRFLKTMALGLGTMALPSFETAFAKKKTPVKKLKIGHTCITWGTFPRPGDDATLEPALKDISAEGFWSFETFPEVLDNWDKRGLLAPMIAKYGVPLRSGYITGNLIDPSKRKDEIARIVALSKVVQKFNGAFVVLAPNSVKRDTYNFQEHRADIISALNDYAAAITDLGLATGLHQHTGTCIESRDEVYTVMEAVNTKNLKFAPDVGQLQKGGADAAKVVKDFLPLVKHMHLKDYKGWEWYSGYCPLGMGTVDIPAILDMVESVGLVNDVMVELDPSPNGPMTPLQTVQTTKAYLQKLGFTFRT
jgi:inosose dehydratase